MNKLSTNKLILEIKERNLFPLISKKSLGHLSEFYDLKLEILLEQKGLIEKYTKISVEGNPRSIEMFMWDLGKLENEKLISLEAIESQIL